MTHVIDPSARIADDVHIGPFVMIGPNVEIGAGTRIEGFASIGTPAEHRDHYRDHGPHGVKIGQGCVIREFVTVNAGTERTTVLGNGVTMLRGSHAGHDCVIESDATISCGVLIGGHSWIGTGANLGLGAVVHQRRAIGGLSMIGMNATVTKDIPPFVTAVGTPARAIRLNQTGIERAQIDLDEVREWWDSGQEPATLGRGIESYLANWMGHGSTGEQHPTG